MNCLRFCCRTSSSANTNTEYPFSENGPTMQPHPLDKAKREKENQETATVASNVFDDDFNLKPTDHSILLKRNIETYQADQQDLDSRYWHTAAGAYFVAMFSIFLLFTSAPLIITPILALVSFGIGCYYLKKSHECRAEAVFIQKYLINMYSNPEYFTRFDNWIKDQNLAKANSKALNVLRVHPKAFELFLIATDPPSQSDNKLMQHKATLELELKNIVNGL